MVGIKAGMDHKNTFSRLWSRQCKLSGSDAVPQLQFFEGRHHPCCGALRFSRSFVDHRDSPVAREQGDRRPCYAVRASSTGAVVETTVVLPQLHLLRNSLRAAHELSWGFLGPCTQVHGRGSCPQGHGPHNQLHVGTRLDRHTVALII